MKLPKARSSDLVVMETGLELLIYDLKINNAYQLNETSVIVFNACDGVQTSDDLKRKHKFTDDLIYLTLDKLNDKNLLIENYSSPLVGISRREVIRKVGLSSMMALPIIIGITAPRAANASSVADLCEGVECPYAQDDCHDDGVCDPATGDCISPVKPNGTPCDDGNASTTGDVCMNGVCRGTPRAVSNRR